LSSTATEQSLRIFPGTVNTWPDGFAAAAAPGIASATATTKAET
jgi:hypothetical protein